MTADLRPGATIRTTIPLYSLHGIIPLHAGSLGYVLTVREGMIEVFFEDYETRYVQPHTVTLMRNSHRDWSRVAYRDRVRLAYELASKACRERRYRRTVRS